MPPPERSVGHVYHHSAAEASVAGLTYQGKPRTCGFRLSVTDALVLIAGTLAGAAAYQVTMGYSLFVPFVVYHFFLFCNVFRITRKSELVWSAVLLVHAFGWLLSGTPYMPMLFGLQFVFTVVVIVSEIRSPMYHGVFSRRLNPRIDEYLSGQIHVTPSESALRIASDLPRPARRGIGRRSR